MTPEHRIFRIVNGQEEEIRAGEARVGDDLMVCDSIPVAGEAGHDWPAIVERLSNEELAWLLGVYIADGWHEGSRSTISGRDGKPKEEQKRRIAQLMERAGVPTRWHEKYIALNEPALARFFARAGSPAPEKHVPSLCFVTTEEVHALLEGLAADATQSDSRTRVYGTTSSMLALQIRVLYRMLGTSTHIRRVDDHGGLGSHPIYRVTVRDEQNSRKDMRYARIRAIQDGGEELCADLTTDRGRFWLPESDVVVHNCDDQSILISTLLALNGIEPRLRVTATSKREDWSHIYPVAGLPKYAPTKWVAVDSTLPGRRFGFEAPYGKHVDFDA